MTTFSIINPSDCFTMEADDLKVAQMAAIPVTAGQGAMAKGIDTVWEEIEGDLLLRGVDITKGTP